MLEGVGAAFAMLYKLLIAVMLGALVVAMLLSVGAVGRFWIAQSVQTAATQLKRSLPTADMFEYSSIFKSYRTKSRTSDPYLTYTLDDIVGIVFYVMTLAVLGVGLHVGITLAGSTYQLVRGGVGAAAAGAGGGAFDVPTDVVLLAVVVLASVLVLTWISTEMYSRGVSGEVAAVQSRVDDFNALVYDNLYANPTFMAKLLGDDPGAALATLMETKITAASVAQGVFTINMWQYFRDRMSDADPTWEEVKKVFSVDVINSRAMDLTPFVSYSLFSTVPNRLFDLDGTLPLKAAMVDEVTSTVNQLMGRLNKLMHNLNPDRMKVSFGAFLMARAAVLLAVFAGLFFYYRKAVFGFVGSTPSATPLPLPLVDTPPTGGGGVPGGQ